MLRALSQARIAVIRQGLQTLRKENFMKRIAICLMMLVSSSGHAAQRQYILETTDRATGSSRTIYFDRHGDCQRYQRNLWRDYGTKVAVAPHPCREIDR
jgi:hypothetical protein